MSNETTINETTILQETEEVERVKPYTLKPLSGEHIVPMVTIIRKVGLNELKKCISEDVLEQIISAFTKAKSGGENDDASKEEKLASIGFSVMPTVLDVAEVLFANIEKAEEDIFRFLGMVSDMSAKDVKKLPMLDVFEMIIDIVQKDEFKGFYRVASKLFK